MPEKIKLNINNFENDCEKVRFLADEYLHGELSAEDKDFLDRHILDCLECFDFIAAEKIYFEEIKLAEYVPEISVAKSVMDKIIENKIIADKPPRRRIMPMGFISAAAVIIIMFALTRGGTLNIFMQKADRDNINNIVENAAAEFAVNDDALFATFGGMDFAEYNNYDDGENSNRDKAAGKMSETKEETEELTQMPYMYKAEEEELQENIVAADEFITAAEAIMAEAPAAAPAPFVESEDSGIADVPAPAVEEAVPAPAPAARLPIAARTGGLGEDIEIPETVKESKFESMDDYIIKYAELDINKIYEIYFIGACGLDRDELKSNILTDVEIFKSDINADMFDIIEKKYKDILNNNLIANNIVIGEILSKEQDGEYIAVIYWCN